MRIDVGRSKGLSARLWRTTPFRLSALFGVIYAVGIVLLLGLVYVQTAAFLTARTDRAIQSEADILERGGPEAILGGFARASARDPLTRFALYAQTGERVAGDASLTPQDLPADAIVRYRPRSPDGPARALAERTPWGEVLIVERDVRPILELRRIVLSALLLSGALIVVLGLGLAIALSLRPLARIQAMRAASDRIIQGDFTLRLPEHGPQDELAELAGIVNRMMDEAERLLIQARTVGEGVAHELRSPLTRLRASLDRAAQSLPAGDDRRDLLDRCVAEADGVLARFHALLRIAALEAGGRGLARRRVSLGEALDQAAELYQPLASERGIALAVERETDIDIEADGELIFEAISNLVDNAVKFTPSGGRVRLRLARSRRGVSLEVIDNGPGIAEVERALVTKRFYRGQRHAQVAGHGLGLSLVAAVAELHGFTLEFDDAGPGAIARLWLTG
ncbi:MAG: HAMP domain-containing histidine kinase [Alphaproteobacteria bacterium]|nr:HAMP domain-containing histidine kinase [Alphaproteobacteria bacterium]